MNTLEYKPRFSKLATSQEKSAYKPKKLFWTMLLIVTIIIVILSFTSIPQYWENLISQGSEIKNLFQSLFDWSSIDFNTTDVLGSSFTNQILIALKETILYAFLGTVLGAMVTIPLALIASTNIIKIRSINYIVKFILAIFRTLPIFLVAMIMAWFLRPNDNKELITMVAAAFFTISTTAKLLYDKIEQSNMATFDLLIGIGVSKTQAYRVAVVPQMTKFTITSLLFAFETNVRYISIIGFGLNVGLGAPIEDFIKDPATYNKAGFLSFLLIMLVFAIEILAWFTKKYIFAEKGKLINLQARRSNNLLTWLIDKTPNFIYQKIMTEKSWLRNKFNYYLVKREAKNQLLIAKIRFTNDKQKIIDANVEYKNKVNNFDFEKHQETLISPEVNLIKYYDCEKMKKINQHFYDQQNQYLTPDYVMLQKPYSWVKKVVTMTLIMVAFIILISQIQAVPFGEMQTTAGLDKLKEMFKPSFSTFFGTEGSHGEIEYSAFALILESIWIAVMGTFMGFILALILGALSSHTVTGKYVSKPFWVIATIIRPTPSYIYALLLVRIVPLGAFAGVLALTIATTSMLAKYIRECFNDVDQKLIGNLKAIGLSKIQIFMYGIVPQVKSEIVSWALYRFDVNIREVATLGVVSAGSMGLYLNIYLNNSTTLNEFATLFYALIITCLILEVIVSMCRNKILYNKNIKLFDYLMHQYKQLTSSKYVASFLIKYNLKSAHNESWYILKSDYLKTIKDLHMLKRKITINPEEAQVVIDIQVVNQEIEKLFMQIKKETNKVLKGFNTVESIKIPLLKKVKNYNSLKFIKAYAIYFALMNSEDNLTTDIMTKAICLNAQHKLLTNSLKIIKVNQLNYKKDQHHKLLLINTQNYEKAMLVLKQELLAKKIDKTEYRNLSKDKKEIYHDEKRQIKSF